jgi:5-formyltetrahydrofolate cyclo-ligase
VRPDPFVRMIELKNQQRRLAYDARNAQTNKDELSQIICQHFVMQAFYQQAETVMWYLHCRSEVRTMPAVVRELSTIKRIVIPYCTQDGYGRKQLGLWWLEDMNELVPGRWGILEPPQSRWGEPGKEVEPEQLDCIMVPGVGFDRHGGRLGNGAGYYDRLLKTVRPDAILSAVCYESQLFERIAMAPHDVAMDFVITEKTKYIGAGRQGS